MARDRLSAIRSQQPTASGVSSPQQTVGNRRSYPEHAQPQFNNPRRPFSPESSFRQPTSELRSPPRVPLGSEPRDWSPALYDEPQSYSGYESPATSPPRVTSPIREQPRPRPPSRMTSAPRDFNPNEYDSPREPNSRHHSREPSREQPRDFDPNEPEATSVRHRILSRKQTGREEEFEERGEGYGTSSRETYSERDGRSSRGAKRSDSDRGGRDSMPILNKNQNHRVTISRGEVPFEDMGDFFAEVTTIQDDIKEANQTIDLISNLYSRYLACPSSEDVQALALHDQLSNKTSSTRGLFASLRNRIHVLEQGNANLDAMVPLGQSIHRLTMSDVSVRQQQVQNLKTRFKDAIQKYAEVEKDNRAKNRAKMERQVRIVYPEMSYEELQGVVRQAEQEGGSALFAQAVRSNGYRSRQAQGALREVQNRAAELSRIEETLVELAQIFSDMATLVEAQDIAIIKIEDDAKEAQLDMEIGLENTKKAVHHARMARKRRWICFFIFVVIFIVLLIVLVVKVVLPEIDKRKNNSSSQSEDQPNNTPTSRPTRGSDSGGSGGTVTVTVTTTVVVVRNPAQSMLDEIPSPTSRQILMTVDPAALAAFVDHPLSVTSPTNLPTPPSSSRSSSTRHSSRHSSSHRSSSSRSSQTPSSTRIPAIPSSSAPTIRQLLVAATPSSRSSSGSHSRSHTSSHPQSSSTSPKSTSSTSTGQSRVTSPLRSSQSTRPTGFVSIRRDSSSRSSSSRRSTSTRSSAVSRPTGLIDSLSSVMAAFSKAHLDAELSSAQLHPPSSASNKSASSSAIQKTTKAIRSAGSSESPSITSIIQALLRRCVSAATPTITF